jgi:hypothetical protein
MANAAASSLVHASPYRAPDDAPAILERDVLLLELMRTSTELPRTALAIYARRRGRAAAGAVLVGGALALVALGVIHLVLSAAGAHADFFPYTFVLLGTLGAAALAFLVARAGARGAMTRAVRRQLVATRDPRADLERLARDAPPFAAVRVAEECGRASLTWPLAGISLTLPLTLHYGVALLCGIATTAFDGWIALSLVLTIPAHLTLACLAAEFGRTVAAATQEAPAPSTRSAALRAWGFTVLASLVPGAVLILIPPALVAVTGIFIPVVLALARARYEADRAELATLAANAT